MAKTGKQDILDSLISTTKLLNYPKIKALLDEFPKNYVREAVRIELEQTRNTLLSLPPGEMESINFSPEQLESKVDVRVRAQFHPSIRPAINATGIILNTSLGRASFSESSQKALMCIAENYCTLAVDIESGGRTDRNSHVEDLLRYITGAEAACVVNNNACAVLLALNTLSEGKEAIISRGQLIEIGGAFRIPDIMRRSNAVMVEVGTTNRTHLFDYTGAITENTGMILVAHTSNYRIIGFTKQVPMTELRVLCDKNNLPLVEDLGSGALIDFKKYNLPPEPTAQQSIRDGVDIVTFSGDKILGGSQCGVIIGKKEYIDRIKKNPLSRALRCGKMTYAVLEATLKLFLDEKTLIDNHPVINMVTLPVKTIQSRARKFVRKIRSSIIDVCDISIIKGVSEMGSGSLPEEDIPTKLVALKPKKISTDELALRLRAGEPPVFTRIADDQVLLDFRTIHSDEIRQSADIVIKAFQKK